MVGKGSDGRVLGKRKQDIKEVWKANMPPPVRVAEERGLFQEYYYSRAD
jgi:hypothetical protein